MDNEFQEWINNLKVSDEVIFNDRYEQSIKTVNRLTPKQIIILAKGGTKEYEIAFWKKNGRSVGQDSFYFKYISKPSEEIKKSILEKQEYRQLASWINSTKFSLNQLRVMKEAYEKEKQNNT